MQRVHVATSGRVADWQRGQFKKFSASCRHVNVQVDRSAGLHGGAVCASRSRHEGTDGLIFRHGRGAGFKLDPSRFVPSEERPL